MLRSQTSVSEPLRISIVTPSLNQGGTIEETIVSILDQSYPSVEHFVIDAQSSDQTIEVLERYPHLRWVSEPDDGQTDAINKGLKMCSGEIFAFLNADDVYRPGAFQRVAELFADPSCDIVVGDCDVIDGASKTVDRYQARLDRPEDLLRFWDWGKAVCVPQPSTFMRRSALELVGAFDQSYDMAMDYEMWLRLAGSCRFVVVSESLAGFRITPDTKTSSRPFDALMETARASLQYVSLAPPTRRLRSRLEILARTAGGVVAMGESNTPHLVGGRTPRELAARAAGFWPPVLVSRRWWKLALFGAR